MISKRNRFKGFTLIEIVAVMAIISILSIVLVPKVLGFFKEAKKTAVISQARKVLTAAESYKIKADLSITDIDALPISTLSSNVSSDMLELSDYDKLGIITTVGDCKKLLQSNSYTFQIGSSGEVISLTPY